MNSPKFSQEPYQSSGGSEPRSGVAQAARQTASKIGSAASETVAQVKESAEKLVSDKKGMAADRVGAYGSAIHESARSLEEEDPNIAWLTHRAAERLDGVASYIRTRDLRGLREDAADLARRHPAAFFGGMAVAGLVLGSVIRAARSGAEESSSDRFESEYPDYMPRETSRPASSYEDTQLYGTPGAAGTSMNPDPGSTHTPEI